jgi:polyphosphate kinase 2 (PPK2 family)
MLAQNDVLILKFFLHISKDEQKRRFEDRLAEPERHWKISLSDFKERPHWDAYQAAYEEALSQCSTEWAPWFVIPANRKWFRDVAVATAIVDALESLDIRFPPPTVDVSTIRIE